MNLMEEFQVKPISFIRSELKNVEDAPSFYTEGAPNALRSRYGKLG